MAIDGINTNLNRANGQQNRMKILRAYQQTPLLQPKISGPGIVITKQGFSPYINYDTNTWWEYNDTLRTFVDTGISILAKLDIGENGNWYINDRDTGQSCMYQLSSLSKQDLDEICK